MLALYTFYYNFPHFSFDFQHYSFYDFIINKARGKSGECLIEKKKGFQLFFVKLGPLFSFDVHDDVRLINDASIERDEVSRVCVWVWVCDCACVCVCLSHMQGRLFFAAGTSATSTSSPPVVGSHTIQRKPGLYTR